MSTSNRAADVADEIVQRGRDHFERLDYGRVWNTLSQDIPKLSTAIDRYRERGGAND